jgi:hypothetical protein
LAFRIDDQLIQKIKEIRANNQKMQETEAQQSQSQQELNDQTFNLHKSVINSPNNPSPQSPVNPIASSIEPQQQQQKSRTIKTVAEDVLKDVKRNGASSATHGNKSARLVNTNSKYDSGFSEPLQNALANGENSEVRRELPPLKGEMRQLSLQSSPNNLPDIDSIA